MPSRLRRDIAPLPPGILDFRDVRGPGFGVPSPEAEAAAGIAFRTEGLLLDPVYTAKAFAVLLDLVADGATGPLVFWHTGGLVAAADHLARSPGLRGSNAVSDVRAPA